MPWMFLVWLLAFMLHCGVRRPPRTNHPMPLPRQPRCWRWAHPCSQPLQLLGVALYVLMQLADLENDYLNPHDAAATINRTVVRAAGWSGRPPLALNWLAAGRCQCCASEPQAAPLSLPAGQPACDARSVNCRNAAAHAAPAVLQLPEYGIQAAATALMLLSGNWMLGVLHLGLLAFHLRQLSFRWGAALWCAVLCMACRAGKRGVKLHLCYCYSGQLDASWHVGTGPGAFLQAGWPSPPQTTHPAAALGRLPVVNTCAPSALLPVA